MSHLPSYEAVEGCGCADPTVMKYPWCYDHPWKQDRTFNKEEDEEIKTFEDQDRFLAADKIEREAFEEDIRRRINVFNHSQFRKQQARHHTFAHQV
jgi:hypothetical protein